MIATLDRSNTGRHRSGLAGVIGAHSMTVVSMASVLHDTFVLIAEVVPARDVPASRGFPQTSGIAPAASVTGADGIRELRRVLGLTWEELADLFGVKRRSVHFWASGMGMKPAHAERLEYLRVFAAAVDRGYPQVNHALLTTAPVGSESPLELLIAGNFNEALRAVGRIRHERGTFGRVRPSPIEVRELPPPPDTLVDALHDPVGPTSGQRVRSKKIGGKRST